MQNNSLSLKLRQEASKGNVLEVKALLQSAESSHAINSNINAASTNGNTALLWATIGLEQCLKKNDKVKAFDYKMVIDLLVAYGADDTCTNKEGKSIYDILFQAEGMQTVYEDICAKIIEREIKKFCLSEAKTKILIRNYYFYLMAFFLLKIKDHLNNLTTLNVINFAVGDGVDALALNKVMKILKKTYNYVGFAALEMIEGQKDFFKAYPEVNLMPRDNIDAKQIVVALEQQEFDLGIFCHMDPSNQQHIEYFEDFYPYYLKNNGLFFCTLQRKKQWQAVQDLGIDTYVLPWKGPTLILPEENLNLLNDAIYIIQACDRSKSKKAIMLENTMSSVLDALTSFNAIIIEIARNPFDIKEKQKQNLISAMEKIFSACNEFINQYNHKFIVVDTYIKMLNNLIGNLTNWKITRKLPIDFGKFNFLALIKLIKKIIKKTINSASDEGLVEYAIRYLHTVNNRLADYYIEVGNLKNAETFLMRSTAKDMPDAERLRSHAALAYIKTLELSKIKGNQDSVKAELFQVIKYNLSIICAELQKDKMDGSCNVYDVFWNFYNYLDNLKSELVKFDDISGTSFQEKAEIFALLYKTSLYLNSIINGPRFSHYSAPDADSRAFLGYIKTKADIAQQVLVLAAIVKEISCKPKSGIESNAVPLQKKKKKERNNDLNNDLPNKREPALNRSVVNENNNVPESIRVNVVEQDKLESELSKTIINENNNVQKNIIATVKENDSPKFEVDNSQPAALQGKICSKEHLLFFPRNEQAKVNIQPKISAKETKKTAYEEAMLHPITSNYLPANTLAGIILPTINDVADNELVKKFQETLSRGKIVGAIGKGIKLVSVEECMGKSISNDYIYKIKDPGLDERLYGRRATKEEIKELNRRGIKDCEKYKNIIIFDLLKKHKLQSKKNLVKPRQLV